MKTVEDVMKHIRRLENDASNTLDEFMKCGTDKEKVRRTYMHLMYLEKYLENALNQKTTDGISMWTIWDILNKTNTKPKKRKELLCMIIREVKE